MCKFGKQAPRGHPSRSQPGGSAITRSDAFAIVVAKLGFKPSFIKQGGKQDVSRRPCDKDVALAGYPARFHQGFKALVWHDDRMVEDV